MDTPEPKEKWVEYIGYGGYSAIIGAWGLIAWVFRRYQTDRRRLSEVERGLQDLTKHTDEQLRLLAAGIESVIAIQDVNDKDRQKIVLAIAEIRNDVGWIRKTLEQPPTRRR